MKTTIILAAALIALASPAQAQEQAIRAENNGGGYITLTSKVCVFGGEVFRHLRAATATGASGPTTNGCGAIMRDKVVIIWQSGGPQRKEYPLEDFTDVPATSKDAWL